MLWLWSISQPPRNPLINDLPRMPRHNRPSGHQRSQRQQCREHNRHQPDMVEYFCEGLEPEGGAGTEPEDEDATEPDEHEGCAGGAIGGVPLVGEFVGQFAVEGVGTTCGGVGDIEGAAGAAVEPGDCGGDEGEFEEGVDHQGTDGDIEGEGGEGHCWDGDEVGMMHSVQLGSCALRSEIADRARGTGTICMLLLMKTKIGK